MIDRQYYMIYNIAWIIHEWMQTEL